MPGGWQGSERRATLPKDWRHTRAPYVLKRDGHRCRWILPSGARCPRVATEVDHIGDATDHSYANLRALCEHHHGKRSSKQGNDARRQKSKVKRQRPARRHPGTLG